MEIYDQHNNLILDITVDDTSYRYRAIGGDHNLILKYSLAEHIELPVGAYVTYDGRRYTLKRPEDFKMQHSRRYDYTVTLESPQFDSKIWKFRNTVDGRLKFSLTAKPREHLQMLVDNMNRRGSGWSVGDCIEASEKLINYNHDYCWDALGKMASEFNTELEIADKRVSLRKVEYNRNNPLPLSYGIGNGFKTGVGRSNSGNKPPVEILFVQGGTDNIDPSKYGSKELKLPAGQTIAFDGQHFEGEEGYQASAARRYIVDNQGLSIRRADKALSSQVEDSLDASQIYPKRVGKVTQVIEIKNKAGNLYDFVDSTIPPDLNFEDCLIEGETMTVIFQSGMLAGREFEVKYIHNSVKGKAARRFELVPQEIDGETMPNEVFKPVEKNTYAVFKCALPQGYIRDDTTKTGASWDMFREAVKYLYDNEEAKFTFTGTLDGLWAKKDWLNVGGRLVLGGCVLFRSEDFLPDGAIVRIVGIKDFINNPHSPTIELSNETKSSSFGTDIANLESQEVHVDDNYRSALQFTKRRFRDAKETIDMIESALSDNFTNRINPIAVETMSLLVGDERLQYQFVEAPGNTTAVPHNITFHKDTKLLEAPAGTIQHLTLGIDSIRPSHEPKEYLYWNVGNFCSPELTEPSVKYYLYIKAQKQYDGDAGSAEFKLETITHKLEEEGFYWLLVGILNSEYDGERSFATLYGFTEILPGRITTNQIISSDGESRIDLANGRMKLGDCLSYNEDGKKQLVLKFLVSENANLANLIFRNQRLESTATDLNGNPNFYIDGLKNEVSFDYGNIHFAESFAKIGWLNIVGQRLIGYNPDDPTKESLEITPEPLPDWDAKGETQPIVIRDLTSDFSTLPSQGSNMAFISGDNNIISQLNGIFPNGGDLTYSINFKVNIPIPNVFLYIDNNELICQQYTESGYNDYHSHKPLPKVTVKRDGKEIGTCNVTENSGRIYLSKSGLYDVTIEVIIPYPVDRGWNGIIKCNISNISITKEMNKTIIGRDGIMSVYNANYIRIHAKEGISKFIG